MATDRDSTLRVAFWNTWLLSPRLWAGGPRIPGGDKLGLAPDVAERAPLVGQALADRFDVVALGECFEASERRAVAAAWPDALLIDGPGRGRSKLIGSGLASLVDRRRAEVVATARHTYRSGGDLRDSDTFASKGALFVRVSSEATDAPLVDLFSTHLIAGGDLFPIPGHDDHARHHRARMAQVDELVDFLVQQHDPANVLVVLGDFNVPAHDPDPSLADPTERYRDLSARLTSVGLRDLWATDGVGAGSTCTFTDPADLPPDPEEPDRVVDDPDAGPEAPGERIDYLWLRVPDGVDVGIDRPRRWAFPGRAARGGRAGSLSDHLALSVTLHL
ncbi:MAG: hypothetical protein ACR2MB_16040 [Acidimicrobiales bacterium]